MCCSSSKPAAASTAALAAGCLLPLLLPVALALWLLLLQPLLLSPFTTPERGGPVLMWLCTVCEGQGSVSKRMSAAFRVSGVTLPAGVMEADDQLLCSTCGRAFTRLKHLREHLFRHQQLLICCRCRQPAAQCRCTAATADRADADVASRCEG